MSLYASFEGMMAGNKSRSSIGFVRNELDGSHCMSLNPFFRQISREDLFRVLEGFAENIVGAARLLSEKTNVKMFDVDQADSKVQGVAIILTAASVSAEDNLQKMFSASWADSDRLLRALEEKPESVEIAEEAMQTLKRLYATTLAAPKVYERVPAQIASTFMFKSQEMHI